ncbi:MAG: STAS domain-containing protein [Deltaproteobacteria bacterium]|nr:STAS domain-containing protein [Deltaproteobacteria bacterium]
MLRKNSPLVFELLSDLGSPKALPALLTGSLNGLLLVIISVSFAAMIFSAGMDEFATRAAGLTLFGTGFMGILALFMSGIKTHVAITQDAPTATLMAAAPVAAALLTRSGEEAFMTLTAILFLSAVLTGVAFLLISRYQLANFFRFVPFPVVGGFLAGSGWMLALGGIGVMCGQSPSPGNLPLFLSPAMLWKWGPGIAITLVLFGLMQWRPHYLILPLALVTGVIGYYAAFVLSGLSWEQLRADGFLVSGLPTAGLWPAFSFHSLAAIHWDVVLGQTPLALTVALISILGMLLNTSGIEVAAAEDLDLNREFKTLGVANLVAGLGGSLPGYTTLSLTMLGIKTRAETRLGGVVSTSIVLTVLLVGGKILTWFPKPLLGSLLVLLGIFLLWDWLVLAWQKMPLADYLLILVITLLIAWKGFLMGVAAGMAATLVLFVIRFSQVSPVQAVFDLRQRRSRRQRSVPDQHLLAMEGGAALGFELGGYLFFGSASAFVEKVRGQLSDSVQLLLLDFRQVTGFDSSADSNFQRLLQSTSRAGVHTFLSHCPGPLEHTLGKKGDSLAVTLTADLDSALEQGEELLLARAHQRLAQDPGDQRSALFDVAVDAMMQRLERLEWCESLTERLAPYSRERSFARDEAVVRIGEPVPGLLILVSGRASETDPHGVRREWENAAVLHPQAQFGPLPAGTTLTAEDSLKILCVEPEARRRLETADAALALELDRYILFPPPPVD